MSEWMSSYIIENLTLSAEEGVCPVGVSAMLIPCSAADAAAAADEGVCPHRC